MHFFLLTENLPVEEEFISIRELSNFLKKFETELSTCYARK